MGRRDATLGVLTMEKALDEEARIFRRLIEAHTEGIEGLAKHGVAKGSLWGRRSFGAKTYRLAARDLHGKTVSEARLLLDEIVSLRSRLAMKSLRALIVTGKGRESSPSILKDFVERYFMDVENAVLKEVKDAKGEVGSYELTLYPL